MDNQWIIFILVIISLYSLSANCEEEDLLKDFSFDGDNSNGDNIDGDNLDGDNHDGDGVSNKLSHNWSTSSNIERSSVMDVNSLDNVDTSEDVNQDNTENTDGIRGDLSKMASMSPHQKAGMLQKIMNTVMERPGGKEQLAQVLPIIRSMSAVQRLTLATLVMKQLYAKSGEVEASTLDSNSISTDKATAELMLPISADIASLFRGAANQPVNMARSAPYYGPYYNRKMLPPPRGYGIVPKKQPVIYYNRRTQPNSNGRRRPQGHVTPDMRPPPPPPSADNEFDGSYEHFHKKASSQQVPRPLKWEDTDGDNCILYTNELCIEMESYPSSEISKSIDKDGTNVMDALVMDASNNILNNYTNYEEEIDRRQGNEDKEELLQVCSTKVKYARPKKARSMDGKWKYVVNTGEYSQTIRVETCLNANKECSYMADNVKSTCTQLYNYHRLLTWHQETGLSMDIFKIPSCCSCQLQSVNPVYSHLSNKYHQKPDPGIQDNYIVDETVLFQSPPVKPKPSLPNRVLSYASGNRSNKYKSHGVTALPKREISNTPRKHPSHLQPTVYTQHDQNTRSKPPPKHQINKSHEPHRTKENWNKRTEFEEMESSETDPARRINYNYHPILDFFRTTTDSAQDKVDDGIAPDQPVDADNWMPITDTPRAMPK